MASLGEPEAEALPREELAGMHVDAIPGRGYVLAGAKNAVQVVVRINTPKIDESQTVRPPLHVACVMDCSGSMGGQKLDYAKKAVLKLVKHLSACDTLHFVTYDTDARIVFQSGDLSETGKEGLRQQIQSVRAGGQTNLCGGLDIVASLLGGAVDGSSAGGGNRWSFKLPFQTTSSTKDQADGTLRRIFLFSDGRVNVGIKDPESIRRKVSAWANAGITTGTFGIGADFDEPLMRGIAASGQGRYQFLATAQDIPKLVSKSVHDLIDIYASDAVLDLRGGEHTIVTRVYGCHDEEDGDRAQTAPGLLHLGDIHSDNLRVVLADLEVAPPGNAEHGLAFDAVEWVLTCQSKGMPVHFSGQVQLRSTRDRGDLGDEAPTVQMAFAVRRATDLEREVAEQLSRRNRQRARDIKAQQIALLEEALQAGQRQESSQGGVSKELELLFIVLERARHVAVRLEDAEEDEELMARQCWQDRDDLSCASVCGLRERADSSASGGDVADIRDLKIFFPVISPGSLHFGSPSISPASSPSNSLAGSPRNSTTFPQAGSGPCLPGLEPRPPSAPSAKRSRFGDALLRMAPRTWMPCLG